MKCCCHIHREMNDATSSVWAGATVAFAVVFFAMGKDFTLSNVMYWWTSVITLRLLAIETVRYVMLRKRGALQ